VTLALPNFTPDQLEALRALLKSVDEGSREDHRGSGSPGSL